MSMNKNLPTAEISVKGSEILLDGYAIGTVYRTPGPNNWGAHARVGRKEVRDTYSRREAALRLARQITRRPVEHVGR